MFRFACTVTEARCAHSAHTHSCFQLLYPGQGLQFSWSLSQEYHGIHPGWDARHTVHTHIHILIQGQFSRSSKPNWEVGGNPRSQREPVGRTCKNLHSQKPELRIESLRHHVIPYPLMCLTFFECTYNTPGSQASRLNQMLARAHFEWYTWNAPL